MCSNCFIQSILNTVASIHKTQNVIIKDVSKSGP